MVSSPPTPPPPPTFAVPFPDVGSLLQSSRPGNGMRSMRPGMAMGLLVAALFISILPLPPATRAGLALILWTAFIGTMGYFWWMVRNYRAELAKLDQVEDLLALKRHYDAVPPLHWMMSQPMRTEQNRLRAMVMLAGLLTRLNRHEDALVVYNELVEVERVAGPTGAMVKLARTMSMLHSDHLYDADRAINQLRRLIDRGAAEEELQQLDAEAPPAPADALAISALRLVELYRDVKTGHAQEAVDLFEQNLPVLRTGLGHRVGEAHALAAVAYDRLGRADDARQCFLDGTALTGVVDLLNRYPELRPLLSSYSPTPAPRMA